MPLNVFAASAAVTAATSAGVLTVADTTLFYEGAIVWLTSGVLTPRKCAIIRLLTSTTLSVRVIATNSPRELEVVGGLGTVDLSGYSTGRLDMAEQFVRVYAHTGV